MSSLESKYNTPPVAPYNTSPILIAFTLGILVLCFALFTVVYLCKYCFPSLFQNQAPSSLIRLSPERIPPSGLDPSLLQLFPTFCFASVKDLPKDKYSHECSICLLEFEDDSMLRLLTLCCHVFHQECIDLWLLSHKTCPVCRTDLDSPTNEASKLEEGVVSTTTNEIRIDVREEGDEDGANVREQRHEQTCECECDHNHMISMSTSLQQQEGQMFARSHSTGHSIILIREDVEKDADKYTLRLSENAFGGRHNNMRSCASYNEMKKLVGACSNCGFFQSVSS